MKTISNLFLIFVLAGFAAQAHAQNTGDIRNSYNNDLPWTSEPEGVTPGPPAPSIEFSGTEDARDIQNYSDIEQSMLPTPTVPQPTICVVSDGGYPAPQCFRTSEPPPVGGFHGIHPPIPGGFHDGGSHDGGSHGRTPPPSGSGSGVNCGGTPQPGGDGRH